MYSNSTSSGYDIELYGNLINAGLYLAVQYHDFTDCISFQKVCWNNLIEEYKSNFKSTEDQLEYDFSIKNDFTIKSLSIIYWVTKIFYLNLHHGNFGFDHRCVIIVGY